jgi:hypothetical protein
VGACRRGRGRCPLPYQGPRASRPLSRRCGRRGFARGGAPLRARRPRGPRSGRGQARVPPQRPISRMSASQAVAGSTRGQSAS